MTAIAIRSSAIFSNDRRHRYRLERHLSDSGALFAFFGVNGSKAGADNEDHTTRKLNEFTARNGGRGYLLGNPYAFLATKVRMLATADDPIGPDNDQHLAAIIAEADILVPCWGDRGKLPRRLRPRLYDLTDMIFAAGKPVRVFGFTAAGDPKHPLMLGYDTPLVDWHGNTGIFG